MNEELEGLIRRYRERIHRDDRPADAMTDEEVAAHAIRACLIADRPTVEAKLGRIVTELTAWAPPPGCTRNYPDVRMSIRREFAFDYYEFRVTFELDGEPHSMTQTATEIDIEDHPDPAGRLSSLFTVMAISAAWRESSSPGQPGQ